MSAEKSMCTTRRTFVKAVSGLGALATLSGCGKGNVSAKTTGGTLNVYNPNPVCIDPYNMGDQASTNIGSNLFDSLVKYDYKEKKLLPAMAQAWEASADNKVFTFHLKEGVRFHNGEACDAQSFKRGWERMVNPKTQGAPSSISYHISAVKGYNDVLAGKTEELVGLTCPDEKTFQVELDIPFGDFPIVCAHPALAPMPKAALENPKDFLVAPIGNGPFKMDGQWVDGQYINLKRFDDYYGQKPTIDAVHVNIQKDTETGFKEFQAGNLDIANIPTTQFKATQEQYGKAEDEYTMRPKHQVAYGPNLRCTYILPNLKDALLQDQDLRRALSLAINRQAICDSVYQGDATPADNIVPPTLPGYQKGVWEYCKYDKAQANQLLDKKYPRQADGSRNITVNLAYNLDGSWKDVMQAVANDWREVGIKVETTTKQWAAILQDVKDKKYQLARFGWSADYPILDNFMYPLFFSDSGDNNSGYKNKAIDDAIIQARAIKDEHERLCAYQEINKGIARDFPVIPLVFNSLDFVASDRVKEMYMSPDNPHFSSAHM